MENQENRAKMSDFVRESLETLEQFIAEGIRGVSFNSCIGIYGYEETASVIHLYLRRNGWENIFFIAKNDDRPEHRGCLMVNVSSTEIHKADVIFTTSLARSSAQKQILLENGYAGKIVSLPDLSHISVELLQDSSTIENIEAISNCHRNQPAFVIGNGPSLRETDPRLLGDRFMCFAGNGIVKLDGFCPDYFFALDRNAVKMWAKEIASLNSQRFFPGRMKADVINYIEDFERPGDIYFPMSYVQQGPLDVFNWQRKGFESGHTVISPMLQFALLMGCRPIYLIGVDISYTSSSDYFIDSYHPEWIQNYWTWDTGRINQSINRGIERAVSACRQAGVEVYNCAPTKNIPILENLDFFGVIGKR